MRLPRVNEVNPIPFSCQPQRVGSPGSAHVEYDGRWRRQEPTEEFAGPYRLQSSPGLQAIALRVVPVVSGNLWIEFWRHNPTLSAAAGLTSLLPPHGRGPRRRRPRSGTSSVVDAPTAD